MYVEREVLKTHLLVNYSSFDIIQGECTIWDMV